MTDIEFFNLVKLFKFHDVGEVVVGENQNLKIGEF